MCDLIDLESPDRKGLLNSRLASPLIPVPTDTAGGNCDNCINDPIPLIAGKRDSLDNNPFDMVLHKTTKYIQTRDDPFEVTLEKAMRPKCKKTNESRTCSLDFTDDYTLKQKNCIQKLRMNKTLDESLINEELHPKITTVNQISNDNMIIDSNNIINDNLKATDIIFTIDVQDVDLSILNQSLMNDTLFDTDKESSRNEMAEEDKINIGQTAVPSNLTLKVPKPQRSLSNGGTAAVKKSRFKFLSLPESPQSNSRNENNIFSLNSLNFLNEGFLTSRSSTFSSLSNISSITKLNSVSSTIDSSNLLSSDTINQAFLDSCPSAKSEHSELIKSTDFNKAVTPTPTKCTTSKLTDQFNELEAKILEKSEDSKNFKEQNSKECCIDNKLVDIDVFKPEINCSKESSKNSVSDTSSDSVFLEVNKGNKSIFHEAKLLAKTFEELALKSSSASSTDDLISSNPLWTSELLPAFDDEDVDNLIELPVSPNTNDTELKSIKIGDCTNNETCTKKEEVVTNKLIEDIKELELELVEPVHTEKRITAATLLLELKKLIKTDNNQEANKLLENLEKVLGINCENNTELLTTCLTLTNNLAKSPQKSDYSLEVIQNIAKNNMEQSQEDNLTNDSNNIKESPVYKNINLNDPNIDKCIDTEKCLNKINSESPKTSTEKTEEEINEKEVNIDIAYKEDSSKKESNDLLNEKVVTELLMNIGKLLTAQTEEYPIGEVLKNLGRVLNFTSSNDNKDTKGDGTYIKIQQTPKKSKLKSEEKISSVSSKSITRLSLNTEAKKQSLHKNFIRRSMSMSQTSSTKNQTPSVSRDRNSCQLTEVTKRFPSDPVITKNNKNELEKDTQTRTSTTLEIRKEKSATINTVKNKLKKKVDADVINKKGPMKAILPIGTMQKKESINNKVTSSYGIVTPPKSHKIISSTPNSMNKESATKRSSRSSKPVASSTPEAHNPKSRKVQSQIVKKRNFSCDISPIIICSNVANSKQMNGSPKRKIPSPKKATPKRRSVGSSIPRSQTPPVTKRLNSSFDVDQHEKIYESPQRSSYKTSNSQMNSPVSVKKNRRIQ